MAGGWRAEAADPHTRPSSSLSGRFPRARGGIQGAELVGGGEAYCFVIGRSCLVVVVRKRSRGKRILHECQPA